MTTLYLGRHMTRAKYDNEKVYFEESLHIIYLEIKTHMFPISNVTAIFFKRTHAHATNGRYRPAAKESKIQYADRFSLAKRIEHPIGHVKVHFLTFIFFSDLFESRHCRRLKLVFHERKETGADLRETRQLYFFEINKNRR